ncbi:MAG: hypothetical protein KKC20_25075 [Proteobacteria bacterium]|nr:hypothetical protein [Pseudomonadota bacterium]
MNTKKRIFLIIFILVEIVIFSVLTILLGKNISLTKPISINLDQTDWIAIIVGLGGSIYGWIALFRKEKPVVNQNNQPPYPVIQNAIGDHSRNINTHTYYENRNDSQAESPGEK